MKKFILITTILAAMVLASCAQKPADVIQVNPTSAVTLAPQASEDPIASAEPINPAASAEVGFTAEPALSAEPAVSAAVSATPSAGETPSAVKGMLDNVPEFKSKGKFIEEENAEDIGILQVEDVTEQEFLDYIKLIRENGFVGEIENENSEMRSGCFTNDTYAINVTFTVQSGYPTEFLLCVSVNE